ncbi:MAG: ATP-binding protein [Candidatus Sericytochromatia bacterium]
MTMFEQPVPPDGGKEKPAAAPVKRPSSWSPSNWPVAWKVLAIAVIPIVIAAAFGGLRAYQSFTDWRNSDEAAQRADMVGPIADYTGSLESALLAYSSGAEGPVARKIFDDSRAELERRLSGTAVDPDVRAAITTMLNSGPALLDRSASNSIGLIDTVTTYMPILSSTQDAIVGSVRVDDENVRTQTVGLGRAVGVRGQVFIQQLLVARGGEISDPDLRTQLTGLNQALGSPASKDLQDQMAARMAVIADPAAVLVGNPELVASLQATGKIAKRTITDTMSSITTFTDERASSARTAAIRDLVIVVVAILLAVLVVLLMARSLVRPLRRLREGALRAAHEELPNEVERIHRGGEPEPIQPIPVYTTEEIGQVAHAVDDLHEKAVLMAAEQSRLQLHVSDMFETMSRRSRSLVDQQLALIDELERNEDDPQRLDALFKLDHLAAQMRRTGTNLLVLAGAKLHREQPEPVPVADVVKAAASQVEDYQRVVTGAVTDSAVVGPVSGDVVHLLAELLDNALRYSPPGSEVRVSAVQTGDRGLVIEVSDSGLGMTEADLRMANTRLESGGEVTPYTARHMGLFVVGRLAAQHGLVVRLRSSVAGEPQSGTTVGVFVPAELIHRPGVPGRPRPEERAEAMHEARRPAEIVEPHRNEPVEDEESALPHRAPGASGIVTPTKEAAAAQGDSDVIFQKMVSEWLIDPQELMQPFQSWESVWDSGWEAAAQAEHVAVEERTESGLPVRDPGARLVPGSTEAVPGAQPNGAAHRKPDEEPAAPNPDAVRASLSSHWGGVRAGRSHAREDVQPEQSESAE